ncbi:DUF6415 family natural product biosynthesis protein [Streptomyces griseofuscus]|uniref:DUF6415 family natural product biosynthesis protein n=1 Tax=Streptomyces griseofuscus TaxID=146922 RepID=UPI0037130F81
MTSHTLVRRGSDGAPRWDHPVEPARRPAEAAIEATLAKVRAWSPYDGDAMLDDVADALDPVPTPEDNVEELRQRLRGHLMQLLGITANYGAGDREQPDPRIKQASSMCEEEMQGDYRQGLAHLRRMGWAVNELLDLLVEREIVKKPDSLNSDSLPPIAEAQPLATAGTATEQAPTCGSTLAVDQAHGGQL